MPRKPNPPPVQTDGPKVRKEDLDSSVGGMRLLPKPSERMTVSRALLKKELSKRCMALAKKFAAQSGYVPSYIRGLEDGANMTLETLTALGVLYVE